MCLSQMSQHQHPCTLNLANKYIRVVRICNSDRCIHFSIATLGCVTSVAPDSLSSAADYEKGKDR